MTQEEILRRTLHRTWFTWPSWLFYAWTLEREYERWLEENERTYLNGE